MARKRMISPDFFTSRPVAALPIPAMVTLVGLWVYVDDYGRGEDDVPLVKATVWPRRKYAETKVSDDLAAIATQRLICRYVVAGYELLHFPSWEEHQKISHRTESKLPPCPTHDQVLWSVFQSDSGGPLEKFRSLSSGFLPNVVQGSSDQLKVVQEPSLSARLRGDLKARRQGGVA